MNITPAQSPKKEAEDRFDPIPVVYMPRKPNPNGLLAYGLATKSAKTRLPFIVDFEPYLAPCEELGSREALKRMISRCTYPKESFQIVADSAFSGVEFLQEMKKIGVLMTVSSKTGGDGVWKLLDRKLKFGHWKACGSGDGLLFSSQRNTPESRDTVHHLTTTGFSFGRDPYYENPESTVPTTSSPKISAIAPTEPPLYSKEVLRKMKVVELKDLAKEKKIKVKGKKENMVEKILVMLAPTEAETTKQDATLKKFDELTFTGLAIHHDLYRSTFNSIDIHDRHWNSCKYTFALLSWRSKMLLSILGSAVINAWVLLRENHEISLREFRTQVVGAILAQPLKRGRPNKKQ